MHAHTDRQTSVNLERTPPEVGQLKIDVILNSNSHVAVETEVQLDAISWSDYVLQKKFGRKVIYTNHF